jgi:hypothetical protein
MDQAKLKRELVGFIDNMDDDVVQVYSKSGKFWDFVRNQGTLDL